jgi:(p)ppGpp synthase/HD superfamily hydrolase
MDPSAARDIAYRSHGTQRTRCGELAVEHLERVAAGVPPDAQTVAFLHDVLEHTSTSSADLEALGLGRVELDAVRILTRGAAESFEAHALRIAYATGEAGRLARAVKLADIEDHLARDRRSTRPYQWARCHIVNHQALHSAA